MLVFEESRKPEYPEKNKKNPENLKLFVIILYAIYREK